MQNAKLKVDIDKRAYEFALQIVKLTRSLPKETAGFEIGRQLLRSGTSVAANIEEAQAAFSKDDFIYKMSIALKEARESNFWLRLVRDSDLYSNFEDLVQESVEIKNILGTIVKTARKGKV